MSASTPARAAPANRATLDLSRSVTERRSLVSALLTGLAWLTAIVASVPLFSVLYMLAVEGGSRIDLDFFTELPPEAHELTGGGIGPAIVGTLTLVGIAAALAIPFGVLVAIFLAELRPVGRLASTVRFTAKTLTGLPSILAGVFVYAAMVVTTKSYSAVAGGIALGMLMLPTVILTAEEAMKMVPQKMKNAAYGMGCTRTQVIWKVVLPTGLPGILTGVMLAVARACGETAPLLFTALYSSYYLDDVWSPTSSLAVTIYNFSGSPFPHQVKVAWAASLVLVLIVLVLNIVSRSIGRNKQV